MMDLSMVSYCQITKRHSEGFRGFMAHEFIFNLAKRLLLVEDGFLITLE